MLLWPLVQQLRLLRSGLFAPGGWRSGERPGQPTNPYLGAPAVAGGAAKLRTATADADAGTFRFLLLGTTNGL